MKTTLIRILFALAAASCVAPASAQITAATYPFSATSGVALEDMSTGTTTLVGADLEDSASAVANIGFDFYFIGTRQTQFSVNANGLFRLGPAAVGTAFDNSAGFAAANDNPKLAPYFDDLRTGANGRVHSRVVGTAPARKLVVEWQNMQIPRGAPGSPGTGTFQAWLFEGSGVIQFVYGSGIGFNATSGGYSIGLANGATAFASVTSAGNSVSYAAANNTQTGAIAAGTSYRFTPPAPTPPTGLGFSGVTATGMTLSWTDSPNETAYLVERSTDGANYSFFANPAAGTTSFPVTGLTPSTTYFWRVYSVSSGALSAPISGSQATTASGSAASTGAGGLWSAPATWVGGVVPAAGDNVTITGGSTVTVDTAAVGFTLTVNGTLEFEAGIARTLTVGSNASISSSGIVRTAAIGTVTGHVFSVGGNLSNAGVLDLSTNNNTAGATLTFTGAANATFSGAGSNDVRQLALDKGTSAASTLEITVSGFTHLGVATSNTTGWLLLTNGTLKLSGTFAGTNRVFASAAYTIPATAGFWLNNPAYTVAGQAGGTTTANNGLLRVTQGVFNIGAGAADGMGGGDGAVFIVEGGTVNASGRIDPQGASSWTQTGGTVNVGVVGNSRSNFGSFELFNTASAFTMSGGTINVVTPSSAAIRVDFQVRSTAFAITGGQVVFGPPGSPSPASYTVIGGLIPAFTINASKTLNVNNGALFLRGTSVTNNGAIVSSGANARFDFAASAAMAYSGSGTFGTAAAPFAGAGVSSNSASSTTLGAPIVTTRVNLFRAGFVNSNLIQLGNGGVSATTVQVGAAGLTSAGGSFDVSPNHQQGSGGQAVIYAFETAPRTTGVEINPTRVLSSLSVDNPNHLTLAGGDLTLSSGATALTLTNGRVITGASTLALSSGTATVVRTNGWVDGNLRKVFAAAANRSFEVGSANGYSPVGFNVTSGTFPATVTVVAIQGTAPLITPVDDAILRHWSLTASGVTANLTFTYLDPADLPAGIDEAGLRIYRRDAGNYIDLGGTLDTGTNQAGIGGITTFSLWTLAEAGAQSGNAPTISSVAATRREGDAASNSAIANVDDFEDAEETLTVTVNGGATATVNGVTVDTISTSVTGVVTANVIAACGATDAAFTLRVTDSSARFAESTLDVTVLPNLAPTLTYKTGTVVVSGENENVAPTTGPSDSGTITGITVFGTGTYTGGASVDSGGVVSLSAADPVGNHTLVIRATDNCNATTDANLPVEVVATNTAPTIAAAGVTIRAGDPVANVTVANTSDVEDPENVLSVTVDGGASATTNGVTVSGIATSAAGVVTANLVAGCAATSASFTLRVTDSGTLFDESTLNVTVDPNLAPVLTYPAATAAVFGQSLNVTPATGATDSGGIAGLVVASSGTYAGGSSAAPGGVITLTGAQPVGSHTLVIRATDNCGEVTDANLVLNVAQGETDTTILGDDPDPSALGQQVTVTYSVVAESPASGTPSGDVTVSDGVDSCTATVAAGQCQITLTTTGARTLVATYDGVADANFNGSSDSESHDVAQSTDLTITKTANAAQLENGVILYTIVATNAGAVAVFGATVTDTFPASVTGVTWTCSGTGGGACSASGNGNIDQLVNLPAGASVTFAITGTVPTNPAPETIVNTASVTSTPLVIDSNPTNNSATAITTIVLFRNGFEDGAGFDFEELAASPAAKALTLPAAIVHGKATGNAPTFIAGYRIGTSLALLSARAHGGTVQVSVLHRDPAGTWHAGPWLDIAADRTVELTWRSVPNAQGVKLGVRER